MRTAKVKIEFSKGKIKDVVIYSLKKFVDERGWLCELFRHDEIAAEFYPAMAYISVTEPNVQRGPHEHADQTDLFCFIGAGNFKLRLWDNRKDSPTYRNVMTLFVGADNPQAVHCSRRRGARLQKRQHDRKRRGDKLSEPAFYGRRQERSD